MNPTLDRDGEVAVMYRILKRIDMVAADKDVFHCSFTLLRKALCKCSGRQMIARLAEFMALLCTIYPGRGGCTWAERLMAHDVLRDSELRDGRHFHALTECLLERYIETDSARGDNWWFHMGDFEPRFRTVSPDHPVARCCSSYDALYHLTDDVIVGRDSDGWLVLMTAVDIYGYVKVHEDGTDNSYWTAGKARFPSPVQRLRRILRILRTLCYETEYVPLPVRMMVVLPDGGTVIADAEKCMDTVWSDLDIQFIWRSDKLGTWWMCDRTLLPRDNDYFYLLDLVRQIDKLDVPTAAICWDTVFPYLGCPF